MTLGSPKFDGDSHESSAHWLGMTRSDDRQISICHTAIERYRAAQGKNDYTYFAHDLAVGPADKFQFICFLRKADMHRD